MSSEFFLEIGTEELPAGFIEPALANLQQLVVDKLRELKLEHGGIRLAATPRRLAISVAGIPTQQPDIREEHLGPSLKAGFDADNKPTRAAQGFAASKGAQVTDLQVVSTPKGEYLMLVREVKGAATAELLPGLLTQVIEGISFPKSMQWGNGGIHFARPIQWLLALYDNTVVPCQISGIRSGRTTRGHRIMAPSELPVTDFDQYLDVLRRNFVVADMAERRQMVLEEIRQTAAKLGGQALEDDELVDTVCNLAEWPVGVGGVFEDRFLALPDAVLITSMREHQKYFCITGPDGKLRPAFIAINNTRIADTAVAAAGHQRVLRARLEDALFFFKEDQHFTLAERAAGLEGIIFQSRLGTMAEKTGRNVMLTEFLATMIAPGDLAAAKRVAQLAKADLLTAMVNEFPSLQGSMGRDYARLDGEDAAVAEGIYEHYLPVRTGGTLPEGTAGALVGLADRLDTIAGCFGIGQVPTGTADPFGLRRQTLGILNILAGKGFSLSLARAVDEALHFYGDKLTVDATTARKNVIDFIKGRFFNDQVGRGVAGDTVEAVISVSFDDPVDCLARIEALAAIRQQETFVLLAAAFKRIMNITRENTATVIDQQLLTDPAERELARIFDQVRIEAEPLIAARKYAEALAVILKMKEPVDTFFDQVLVMAEDRQLRQNRLNLLTAIARLFLQVGDFSRIQTAG